MENGYQRSSKKRKKAKYNANQFIETEINSANNSCQVIDEPFIHQVCNDVCYVLLRHIGRFYLLQPDLCLNIQLVPFSSRWSLSCDGYWCKPGEIISVSTCFGHRTSLSIVEQPKSNFEKVSTSRISEAMSLIREDNCEYFIDTCHDDLEKGEIVLLRIEVLSEEISQFRLAMEYLRLSSRYSVKASINRISLTDTKQVYLDSLFVQDDCNYGLLSLKMDQLYNFVQFKQNDIVLVSGQANSGKTSLVHHFINRYVSEGRDNNTIFYLECDPGQTEFTPCGILSLVRVNFKISNALASKFWFHTSKQFTDRKHILSKILGTITPSENADEYFDLICQLFEFYQSLRMEGQPLIINTMGWIEGLGIDLLSKIILLTKPTNVIHLNDNNNDDPFTLATLLDSSHLTYCKFSHLNSLHALQEQVGFKLWSSYLCISHHCKSVPFKASIMRREIQQLSYMIANLWPTISFMPFYAIKPTRLSLDKLHIYVVNCPPIHLSAIYDLLNSTWVFLANIDPSDAIYKSTSEPSVGIKHLSQLPRSATCLGCAVVRTVDPVDKCLYLITPSQLDTVNLIVLPDLIAVPPGLVIEQFMHQDSSSLPYIELLSK